MLNVMRIFLPFALIAGVAAGDHPPNEGLLLWLDASDAATVHTDGDRIIRWDNKAREGHGVSATGQQRPQWLPRQGSSVRAGVRFDGLNDQLTDLEFGQRSNTWTLIVVATPYGRSGEGGAFCSATPEGGNDFDPGFTVDTYQSSTEVFDQISVEGAGRIGGQQDQLQASFPYRATRLIVVERGAEEVRLFIDGVVDGTRPVSPAETMMEEVRVGARYYAGQARAFFDGELHTVLLYGRVLSPEERGAVERLYFVTSAERKALETYFSAYQKAPRMTAPVVLQRWSSLAAYWPSRAAGNLRIYDAPEDLPIRTDLRKAIRLSMGHLVSLFDTDQDDEPYFFSNHRTDGTGELHHSVNIGIPHVTGRCLLGLVAAHRATELPIDPGGLAILRRYCRVSFDNPYGLNSYLDPERNNEPVVEFHNVREGLYSLWALMELDGDPWARETAARMVATLDAVTNEAGVWQPALLEATPMNDHYTGASVPNAARAVEPLLALYRATGNETALKLAGLYARAGIGVLFEDDGRFADWKRSSGHVHSITSALAGITEYAILTNDTEMIARCRRIMDVGVPEFHSSWGWGDEVFPEHPADVPGRGEINQTGDVVRTALQLGAAGYTEYYALAERFVRGMLLPTQHREPELRAFMRDNDAPNRDAERDVVRRTVGGYAMQLPNDRMRKGDWPLSTLDITSGSVHALAACAEHQLVRRGATSQVNLLFDAEDDHAIVEASLPLKGEVTVTMKSRGALSLRIPAESAVDGLKQTLNGSVRPIALRDGYAVLEGLKPGDRITLRFPLVVRTERETVDRTAYTTTWLGEQLIDIQPRGVVSPLPF